MVIAVRLSVIRRGCFPALTRLLWVHFQSSFLNAVEPGPTCMQEASKHAATEPHPSPSLFVHYFILYFEAGSDCVAHSDLQFN